MLAEGFGSSSYFPATERFLRYDLARNSVDYLAHIEEFILDWSREGAAEVGDDFAADFGESWPAVIFQHLMGAYPTWTCMPLARSKARKWAGPPRTRTPPRMDHLWRLVDLTADRI